MENTPPVTNQIPPIAPKKISPWVWIIGGCLTIIILIFTALGFFIWWGYHAAKDEFKKQTPNMREFQGKMEDFNNEAEKLWEKPQDLYDAMSNPGDINVTLPTQQ